MIKVLDELPGQPNIVVEHQGQGLIAQQKRGCQCLWPLAQFVGY